MAETTPCPQCNRPTVLTMTLAGTRLRIDAAPSGQGVVIPVQVNGSWRSRILTGSELPAQVPAFTIHDRTCPRGRQRARLDALAKPRCPWCEGVMARALVEVNARGHVWCMDDAAWVRCVLSERSAA